MKKLFNWLRSLFAKLFGKKVVFTTENKTVVMPIEIEAPTITITPCKRHYTYYDKRIQRTIRKPFIIER